MEQPQHLIARWRRAAWQHRGLLQIATTTMPNEYGLGSEVELYGRRYRISHYDVAPDRRSFEVWGQLIDGASAARVPARATLQLFPVHERR